MRVMILILLALTLSFGLIHAQTVFGVKAGMNISRITGDDAYVSADSHLGFHAGILTRLYLTESFILQPELLYTQKGYNHKYLDDDVEHRIRNSFDYVELPALIKFNIDAGTVALQPYAGVAVSYLVNAKSKETVSNDDVSITYNRDVKDDVNTLGFGFLVGADVVVAEKFLAGGRYNFGVSNIYKKGYEGGNDIRNGVLMLSLGYMFSR
jgi:outer membrane immunogenic protein